MPSLTTALPPSGKARQLSLLLMLLAPLGFGFLSLLLGQDANWDLRNYHWYNGTAWLQGRHGFDLLPSQTPFFYNPILDGGLVLLGNALSARGVGFVLGALQGLNFCLIFMIAHAVLNVPKAMRRVAVAAFLALIGMLGAGGIAQLGATFYDNIVSLGLLSSMLLVILRLPDWMAAPSWHRAMLAALLCGIPLGLGLGTKLTLICFAMGVNGALLLVAGNRSTDYRRRWQIAFGFGLGCWLYGDAGVLAQAFMGTLPESDLPLFQSDFRISLCAFDQRTGYSIHAAELARSFDLLMDLYPRPEAGRRNPLA
jgi:hypothetical protein